MMNTTRHLAGCILLIGSLIISASAVARDDAPDTSLREQSVDPPALRPAAPLVLKAAIPGSPVFGLGTTPSAAWRIDYDADFDFNGDGIPEKVYMTFDAKTSPKLFEIVDGSSPVNTWTVSLMEDEGILYFIRFSELDPTNDLREIVFARKRGRQYVNPVVVDAEGNLLSVWDDTDVVHLLTIADVDGDAYEEVVVFNPQASQVEIWGKAG